MSGPKTAMVMAAGLGLRMRPLTDGRPKALVQVGGKALIDHILDRLEAAGVTRAVVNAHAFADQMEDHLARRRSPEILISDERAMLLETGGGLKRARSMLGEAPIWVANSDYVWMEGRDDAGRLTPRGEAAEAPMHCFGVEILDPQRVYEIADEKFSLFRVWQAAAARGRLCGVVPDGYWMQVGDPAALAAAEARLKEAA